MSSFRNRNAGINQQMLRADFSPHVLPQDFSSWYSEDTAAPWSDALIWPNSRGIATSYLGNDASEGNRWAAPPLLGGNQKQHSIAGITRDNASAPLGACAVELFLTSTDEKVNVVVSDTGGWYRVQTRFGTAADHYIVAYKIGSPDRAGTTLNTLRAS